MGWCARDGPSYTECAFSGTLFATSIFCFGALIFRLQVHNLVDLTPGIDGHASCIDACFSASIVSDCLERVVCLEFPSMPRRLFLALAQGWYLALWRAPMRMWRPSLQHQGRRVELTTTIVFVIANCSATQETYLLQRRRYFGDKRHVLLQMNLFCPRSTANQHSSVCV